MVGFADCGMTNVECGIILASLRCLNDELTFGQPAQLFIDHRRRRPLNIQHSTFNIIKAYEEEFLGSRDSHSDSGADGGTDRTGNDELYGLWSVLRTEMRNEK